MEIKRLNELQKQNGSQAIKLNLSKPQYKPLQLKSLSPKQPKIIVISQRPNILLHLNNPNKFQSRFEV
jgi:hypothetical protein